MLVGRRDRELSSRSGTAGKDQENKLQDAHGLIIHQEVGQQDQSGKYREKCHDNRSLHALQTKPAHKSVRCSCRKASENTDQGRE